MTQFFTFIAVNILDFLKGKNAWKEIISAFTENRYCIGENKVNTTKTSFMKQSKVYKMGKKRKSFLFKATTHSLLVTSNFLK